MPAPTLTIAQNEDGSITSTATHEVGSPNWAALLQAIIAALPSLLAIVSAFTGQTPVPVPPSPVPPAPHA